MNFRTQAIPPKPGPKIELRRVGKAANCTYLIVGEGIAGLWTHWDDRQRRSMPCTEPADDCQGHKMQLPQRWKGYLHVYDFQEADQCFLELTPVAAKCLLDQIGEGNSFRGVRVKLTRGNGPKARLRAEVIGHADATTKAAMPSPLDPLEVLAELWGYLANGQPKKVAFSR